MKFELVKEKEEEEQEEELPVRILPSITANGNCSFDADGGPLIALTTEGRIRRIPNVPSHYGFDLDDKGRIKLEYEYD